MNPRIHTNRVYSSKTWAVYVNVHKTMQIKILQCISISVPKLFYIQRLKTHCLYYKNCYTVKIRKVPKIEYRANRIFQCCFVPWLWFLLLDNRVLVHGFQGVVCVFLILALVWFHTILVPNQVEPEALVLKTQLT